MAVSYVSVENAISSRRSDRRTSLPAIRDRPRVHLAHVLAQGADWQHSWIRYVLQPIPAYRPDHGFAVTTLRCDRCGLLIILRIGSVRGTVWRRRAWLVLAVLLMSREPTLDT
jgi:hypothetical protein